jgi:alkaline phosphatase D
MVGGLGPACVYWYRFIDDKGFGSRIGRTMTAPRPDDARPVHFAFVSCQNANQGAQNAYRRMIYEDEHADETERLNFVLHLGDFIYEIVWYPEDRPQGMYDRKIRDIVRYINGERIEDFHVPTTLEDYRAVYRAYLRDPDLQDARARWPFIYIWDNHEFSWKGWQSLEKFNGKTRPAQKKKVFANQAFFEYQPGKFLRKGRSIKGFDAPTVSNRPIEKFDNNGLGAEPNNLLAIESLTAYRTIHWGKNLDLIITDQHSYRSEEPTDRPEASAFSTPDFPNLFPQEAMEILDAGRIYDGGRPPATIAFGDKNVPNYRRNESAQTILGAKQKEWFLGQLRNSKATWKVWGNSIGTLDFRADPQNLPADLNLKWPGKGYAGFGGGDFSGAYVERAQIYDFIRDKGITGFATVFGDRHSFWAGLAAKSLPPEKFEPVGIAFGTGSISAPGLVEALEHRFPASHPLRSLFVGQGPTDTQEQPTVNLLLKRGVKACLEYAVSGDVERARSMSNEELAPHLRFVDMGGHGYAVVHISSNSLASDFVCIPRPLERAEREDGGPIHYRVRHKADLWKRGETPKLEQQVLSGNPKFSV